MGLRQEERGLKAAQNDGSQAKTPFCLGTSGTTAGATTVLDSCTAASSAFTVGFTNTSGTGGTIVQKASGLCLTMADVSPITLARFRSVSQLSFVPGFVLN